MKNVSRIAGLTLAATFASFGAFGVAHAGVTPDKTCGGNNSCVVGTNTGGGNGVLGVNTGTGYGVLGKSAQTLAAVGGFNSNNGSGVYGQTQTGAGINGYANSGFGIQGYSASGDGIVVYGGNNGSDITGSYIGLLGRASSFPFVATDPNGNDLAYLDINGNMFVHGTYNTFAAIGHRQAVTGYAAKSTSPTVEDVGSAHLAGGVANVPLDPAFARSIDGRVAYHVFVTPNGDTRGLYVSGKSATGFVVREVQQGRGSFDFDYRIVATAAGHAGERSRVVDMANAGEPRAARAALKR